MYEHNIIGYTAKLSSYDAFNINFNFTYIDNKSTCDHSDVKNALLKNPSMHVWGYMSNVDGSHLTPYFIKEIVVTQSTENQNYINIVVDYVQANINNPHLISEVMSSVSIGNNDGGYYINYNHNTNKIINLY